MYVYRNRRLIICGTWFDYIKKEPAYNLARIKVDISSVSDEEWKIDIKKSTASLPGYVRDTVERAIDICTEASARVYISRGTYSKSNISAPNLDMIAPDLWGRVQIKTTGDLKSCGMLSAIKRIPKN